MRKSGVYLEGQAGRAAAILEGLEGGMIPLGALVSLKVADPKVLNNPVIHGVPHGALKQILILERAYIEFAELSPEEKAKLIVF